MLSRCGSVVVPRVNATALPVGVLVAVIVVSVMDIDAVVFTISTATEKIAVPELGLESVMVMSRIAPRMLPT